MHFCKFYEVLPALPHQYGACSPDEGRYNYWQIFKYSTASGNEIAIQDCDFADPNYSQCTTKKSGILNSAVPYDLAVVSSETQHPGCQDHMMGNDSNPANIGNSQNPIEVEHDAGDPWIHSEAFDGHPQDGDTPCSNFDKSLPNPQTLTVWDERNAN